MPLMCMFLFLYNYFKSQLEHIFRVTSTLTISIKKRYIENTKWDGKPEKGK